MKNKRRTAMLAASLAIAVFLFCLPYLFSLPPVVRFGLDRINARLPGTLTLQSFSLGWRQGVRCANLQYRDPEQGIEVKAPRLASDKGLFVLLLAPRYLGEVTIDHPVLTFFSAPTGQKTSEKKVTEAASAEQGAGVEPEAIIRSSWWEEQSCRLRVNEGSVTLDHGVDSGQQLARDIRLTASLAIGTISYDIALRSGLRQQGRLRAKGFVNLPSARQSFLDTLISETELEMTDLELASFFDLGASRWNFPRGKGVVDATCHVVTTGIDDLDVQGTTDLKGLQLSGGFLGEDRPTIDRLHFKFKGSRSAKEGWQVTTLHLESDPVRIDASGSYDQANASLDAQGAVNVQAVAAQLPHLLALHEKTTIKEGLVDFSLNVSGTPQNMELKARCRTGRLTVVHDGQPFSWETPLSLVAEADRSGEKTTVRTLQLHTPFLDATGGGGTENFTLRGAADLDRMFGELNKVFTLKYHGQGKLKLSGSSRLQQDGGYRLTTRIDIGDFSLFRGHAPVLPSHDFSLTGEAWALPSFFRDGKMQSLELKTTFWPGSLSLVSRDITRTFGQLRASFVAQGRVCFDRVSSVLQGLGGSVPSSRVTGNLSFDGSGIWGEHRLSLQTLNGTMEQLAVKGTKVFPHHTLVTVSLHKNVPARSDKPVTVHDLVVAGKWQDFVEQEGPVLRADFQQHRLELRHLLIKAGSLTARSSVHLKDWRQPQRTFLAEINAEADADVLAEHLKRMHCIAEDLTMRGRAQASLKLRPGNGHKVVGEVTARLDSFELLKGPKSVFSDPALLITATLQGEVAGQSEVKIPQVMLRTTALQLEGTGMMQRREPASLELQGDVTPDLAFLSRQLTSNLGRRVILTGKRPGLFLFSSPLQGPADLNRMRLTIRLPLDSLQYDQISLGAFDLPIDISQGKLRAIITGGLNGGRVALQPQWTVADRRPVITLPPSSRVLKGVSLYQPLLDQGLNKIHPLFGAWAHPEGQIDMRLDRFSLPPPVHGGGRPDFIATLSVGQIRFAAVKVLRELLDLFGLEHKGLRIKQQKITCTGRDGRIRCSPFQLISNGVVLAISGASGRDGSLDYLVRIPITEYLVGKDRFPTLQRRSIPVRVTGTLDAPFFDRNAFMATVHQILGSPTAARPSQSPVTGQPPESGP